MNQSACVTALVASLAASACPAIAATTYSVNTQAEYNGLNSLTFQPGDQVLLKGGATFNGGLYFDPADAGTAANPITLSSFGTGRATINAGTGGFGFYGFNNGGITIDGINFTGAGTSATTAPTAQNGINLFNDTGSRFQGITLRNLEISGFSGVKNGTTNLNGGTGIVIGGNTHGYDGLLIDNVSLHDNRNAGLITYGVGNTSGNPANLSNRNVTVRDSTAYNNTGIGGVTRNSGSGLVLGSVNGGLMERNTAHDNGTQNTSAEGPVGIWTFDSNNITIQHNESYNNRTSGGDGGGFDLDQNVTNSVLQYNYSHDNDGAGILVFSGDGTSGTVNNTVRYNISENDGRKASSIAASGITIGNKVTGLSVYGNTVYISGQSGDTTAARSVAAIEFIAFGSKPTNVTVANNIFMSGDGTRLLLKPSSATSNLQLLNNDYYTSGTSFRIRWNGTDYNSLAAWLAVATSQERFDKNGDGTPEVVAFNVDPLLTAPGSGGTVGDADLLEAVLAAYRLRGDSPLVDQGLDLTAAPFNLTLGDRDFYGVLIPQGPGFDLGASEVAVPEPTALLLLGVGSLLCLSRRPAHR